MIVNLINADIDEFLKCLHTLLICNVRFCLRIINDSSYKFPFFNDSKIITAGPTKTIMPSDTS